MTEDIAAALARGARKMPDGIKRIYGIFCGCGKPEDAWQWILDYLTLLAESDLGATSIAFDFEGSAHIAAYLMAYLGITDHGGSIFGSWLTKDGEEVLAFLRENGVEWIDSGEWVDSEGLSYGVFG